MARKGTKRIEPTQDAADAVPFGSGRWRVSGSMGLYLRSRARTKTYVVVRRVGGRLVERVLQARTMAAARREAQRVWSALRPDSSGERWTLAQALEQYLAERELRPKTIKNYRGALYRYAKDWLRRPVESVMLDRVGVRSRILHVQREHGVGAARLLYCTLSVLFRYYRRYFPAAPEPPTAVIAKPRCAPRDSALDAHALRRWCSIVDNLPAKERTYWLTVLLTGARCSSVLALRWEDVDFERRTIRFSTAKTKPYSVPMSTRLAVVLLEWRTVSPPSEWVFPGRNGPIAVPFAGRRRGLPEAHSLRHTFRTTLAALGAPMEIAMVLLGHSFGGSVSLGYVTVNLLLEPAREWAEKVAAYYAEILQWQ